MQSVLIMTRILRNIVYTIILLAIVIVPITFFLYSKFKVEKDYEKEEIQYYQRKNLDLINNCDNLYEQLADFIEKTKENAEKKAAKNVGRIDNISIPRFDSFACDRPNDYRSSLPEFDRARKTYTRNFDQVVSVITENKDRKLTAQELARLEEGLRALSLQHRELYAVYGKTQESWFRERIAMLESDYSRRHLYWVYQLALQVWPLAFNLQLPTFDVPAAETQIDQLEMMLEQMNTAMQDDKEWPQKSIISAWASEIPDFLNAAKIRVEFEKNKGATATAEEIEASISTFMDSIIFATPSDLEDSFYMPANKN